MGRKFSLVWTPRYGNKERFQGWELEIRSKEQRQTVQLIIEKCLLHSFCLAVVLVGDNSVIVVEIRLHANYISNSPPQDFSAPL